MYIEQGSRGAKMTDLASDLALHLYTRRLEGNTLVVAERPFEFLRIVRKEWIAIARIIQAKRAKSLDASGIAEFSRQLTYMQSLVFTAKSPREAPPEARVFFIGVSDINHSLPFCHTVYVTCLVGKGRRKILKSRIATGNCLCC